MTNFIKAWHLRLAAKAIAEHLRENPDCQNVKVYADTESRDGYAVVEFLKTTPKGNVRAYKFALHSDATGRRIALVKASAYSTGKTLYERRVPGDMVFPWVVAVREILATHKAAASQSSPASSAGVEAYIGEDGQGVYAQWHVSDLVPKNTQDIRLVFVFESPHVDEVKAGIPVVGEAGQLALDYLLAGQANGRSLGSFVQGMHTAGNGQVAILNVSDVPLQSSVAVGHDSRGLSESAWAMLESVRVSDARTATSMKGPDANDVGRVLLRSLQRRVDDLRLAPDAVIVAGGVCARRFMRSFLPPPGVQLLNVPHPSRRQWLNSPEDPELLEVRRLFLLHV